PYADHDGDKESSDVDHVSTPVSDTLERTLASVAKAEELVQSGRKSEAEAAIQAARLSLESVPKSESGVKQVREKLDDLDRRCEALGAREEDAASTPPKLRGVKAERNDRVDKW